MTNRKRGGNSGRSSRGVALIITISVLAILALLAVAFATITGVEQEIAFYFTLNVRAKLTAESGVHHAVALMQEAIATGKFMSTSANRGAWVYWGDVTSESATGAPNAATAIEEAKNPSFAWETDAGVQNPTDANTTPLLITVDGAKVGFSGFFETTAQSAHGEIYTLKVTDANGRIYINDGIGHTANTENLRIILNNLGKQIGLDKPGDIIVKTTNRGNGYKEKRELLKYFSEEEFKKIEPLITCHAWVDTAVANPVPLSPNVAADYPVKFERPSAAGAVKPPSYPAGWDGKIYRYGRGKNWRGVDSTLPQSFAGDEAKVYGFDELNPQYIEVTSRAPVNINAASREVLVALLDGIQGFFLMETPYRPEDNGYVWYNTKQTFSEQIEPPPATIAPWGATTPSEIGIIYKTDEIRAVAPGTSVSTPNIANTIAARIIENRNLRLGTDDITQPYHGPFRSWAQFNLFIDNLVADGTIKDTTGRYDAGSIQERMASQAIADAIKANFNPNLHLNEINPNDNIHLLVDKTDLIYRTTEFCLHPAGLFEIESLARVLIPRDGTDVLTATDNRTVAEKKITAVVRLFDVHREGLQKHFYEGSLTIDGVPSPDPDTEYYIGIGTNNNYPMETGPEPDNGLGPMENNFEGYLQLSSIGGALPVPPGSATVAVAGKKHKPKGDVWETPRGGRPYTETCHGHFSYDFDLHYAVAADSSTQDLRRRALTRNYNRGVSIPTMFGWPDYQCYYYGYRWSNQATIGKQTFYNFPDWSETVVGPYCESETPGITLFAPADPATLGYRTSRSFSIPPSGSSSPGAFRAPSDLRVDGGYFERHSAAVYWSGSASTPYSTSSPASNIRVSQGAASYWIKPGFFPETAGKFRGFFNCARSWKTTLQFPESFPPEMFNPSSFAHLFLPMNTQAEGVTPFYNSWFQNTPQRSFGFGIAYGWQTDYYSYNYALNSGGTTTDTLNHRGHADNTLERNKVGAHQWVHVTLLWNQAPDHGHWSSALGDIGAKLNFQDFSEILVNGQNIGSRWAMYPAPFPDIYVMWPNSTPYYTIDRWGYIVPIALGEPSIRNDSSQSNFDYRTHNFPADSTIDELYIWNSRANGRTNAINLWRLGRYFRGYTDTGGVRHYGKFSKPVDLSVNEGKRILPPPSATIPTGADPLPPSLAAPRGIPKILALHWTWYAEGYVFGTKDDPLRYVLYDYRPTDAAPYNSPIALAPRMEFAISADGGSTWGLNDQGLPILSADGWNAVRNPDGKTSFLPAGDLKNIVYSVVFNTGSDPLNSILLATPILDDVTIVYDTGQPAILGWFVH